MKTLYSTPDSNRVAVLQNTLSSLRLPNIATLDALMTHFTRLIELTSADEEYISSLATVLAPCILRPKAETSMTLEEKFSYRLVRDLFAHKDEIFSALKRNSSLTHTGSVDSRPRALSSTDESNRKANMEARARAIIAAGGSKSRATSPNPGPRGHRRDRSSGGPETRFPVAVASPTATTRIAPSARYSLEVPNDAVPPPAAEPASETPLQNVTNTNGNTPSYPVTSATYIPGMPDGLDDGGLEKRNSLGRSGHAQGGSRFAQRRSMKPGELSNRDSVGSLGGGEGRGVSLQDRPMDD